MQSTYKSLIVAFDSSRSSRNKLVEKPGAFAACSATITITTPTTPKWLNAIFEPHKNADPMGVSWAVGLLTPWLPLRAEWVAEP